MSDCSGKGGAVVLPPMAKNYTSQLETDQSSTTGMRAIQPGETVVCAKHGTPLVCPSCIGASGGKKTSEAKAAAARENARRPRPRAQGGTKMRKTAEASAPSKRRR